MAFGPSQPLYHCSAAWVQAGMGGCLPALPCLFQPCLCSSPGLGGHQPGPRHPPFFTLASLKSTGLLHFINSVSRSDGHLSLAFGFASSALCFTNAPGILPTCPGCPALLEGDLSSPALLLALALLCSLPRLQGNAPACHAAPRAAPQDRVPTSPGHPKGHSPLCGWGHLRSRGDDDTAHPVEATVPQVQALSGELHLPALEVLLLEDDDLGAGGKGRTGTGTLGEGRAVVHVPAWTLHAQAHSPTCPPRLSKASYSFSGLVPRQAELGSAHEQPCPNTARTQEGPLLTAFPAPRQPHPTPSFTAAKPHLSVPVPTSGPNWAGKELLFQELHPCCGLQCLPRANVLPEMSHCSPLVHSLTAALRWHAAPVSPQRFSASSVTRSLLHPPAALQDLCMQRVTRGSRWQHPTLMP